jgi:sugar phosphate isomerase/epimerase
LKKLAMLASPLGIKVAYEGLSWVAQSTSITTSWDVVCRADCPNLGIGFDSFHIFAAKTSLDAIEDFRPRKNLSGAVVRLHVERNPTFEERMTHSTYFPRVSWRRCAQRRLG